MPTVGTSLSQLIGNLTDLIDGLDDGDQRNQLIAQQKQLAARLQKLIDKNVATDTAEYKKATAALDGANTSLVAARQDVQKVAETITRIAEVIGALGELAASLK
jgi:multidrug efflux pump subunit AcrA (membrane-fusion protein)